MNNRLNSVLLAIDDIVLNRMNQEPDGLITGRGGCVLYLSNRYLQTQNQSFQNDALTLLESIIESTNNRGISWNFCIAHSGSSPFWIIDQLIKKGILDEGEKEQSQIITDFIHKATTPSDLEKNYHDLFYGFIGKALILLESDHQNNKPFVTKIVDTLIKNSVQDSYGLLWKTPDPFHYQAKYYEETINLGIPHGSLGIILFLIKYCEVYDAHDELAVILRKSIDWLINRLNVENNRLPYTYAKKPVGTGRLGWCYGDQAIAYTLLRYHENFNYNPSFCKAKELIKQAASKSIEQSSIKYYPDYGYHDVRICHGTMSVAYMYKKMYFITKDIYLNDLANKWIDITLNCLDIYLPQLDKIAVREKGNDNFDTSMDFLNGLSGVGLALISFLEPKLSDWDKLLLLDRPGRE